MNISQIKFRQDIIRYYKVGQQLISKYSQDIIPGKYQGGFKLWQCQLDLLRFMENTQIDFIGKSVIQIGCGHGLLGIAALKLGAKSVCFQDYNADVIQSLTIPTIQLNLKEYKQKCKFVSGDWLQLKIQDQYDIMLGSEIIYNQQNYQKITTLLKKIVKKNGICILANKFYYFGVGGNIPAFKSHLDQRNIIWKTLQKINSSIGGNKKQILQIYNSQS